MLKCACKTLRILLQLDSLFSTYFQWIFLCCRKQSSDPDESLPVNRKESRDGRREEVDSFCCLPAFILSAGFHLPWRRCSRETQPYIKSKKKKEQTPTLTRQLSTSCPSLPLLDVIRLPRTLKAPGASRALLHLHMYMRINRT